MYENEIQERTPILFALSTCPRCQRMKAFLKEHHINVVIVDVDLLAKDERRKQLDFISRVNPAISFPTLVVGDLAVVGEDYHGVKGVFGL